jgi:hypothetical protein
MLSYINFIQKKFNKKLKLKIMKKITFFILIAFLIGISANVNSQGVAINNTGNPPDASAMLDVTSTSKGMLIPRMTQTQRGEISSPVEGLLIYQTDNTPGFYYRTGSSWVLLNAGNITELSDADGDTKVQVEENPDDDIIHFFAGDASSAKMWFDGKTLEFSSINTFIGGGAGIANSTGVANTFFGNGAGNSNTFGSENVFVGREAGYSNQDQSYNTFVGFCAGKNNTAGNNTFIGCTAGSQNTSGGENVFVGREAGYSNQEIILLWDLVPGKITLQVTTHLLDVLPVHKIPVAVKMSL